MGPSRRDQCELLIAVIRFLRRKTVRLVRVLWRHYGVEESTWSARTRCEPFIPSRLGMKVRSLVV